MSSPNVLDYFDVSVEYLSEVVDKNPSLRGMILGYLAEAKLRDYLSGHGRATALRKDDDHDRKKKGDLVVSYQGFDFKVEVKSLQTHTIELFDPDQPGGTGQGAWVRKMLKQSGPGVPDPRFLPVWQKHRMTGTYRGQVQCDASDKRTVPFPDKSTLETTNLQVGEFHILAAGLFSFREKWDFAFALNRDLPRSTNRNYSAYHKDQLLAGMVPITWPVQSPFTLDVYELLDKLVTEERSKANAVPVAPAHSPPPPINPGGKKRKKKP